MLKIKVIKPLFTNILTTGNKYEKDEKENGLIIAKKGDLLCEKRIQENEDWKNGNEVVGARGLYDRCGH